MAEFRVDGKRAHLYRLCEGRYSSMQEDWWYHERQLTTPELVQLLLDSVPLAEAIEREDRLARPKDYQDVGGPHHADFGDEPFNARETLLRVAGFVLLVPEATFEQEHPPYYMETVADVRDRLLDAQREAARLAGQP